MHLPTPHHRRFGLCLVLCRSALALILTLLFSERLEAAEGPLPVRVLFLGDNGHHQPAARFKQLQPVLARQGIELVYTDRMEDLNRSVLAGYDCLAIYANETRLTPDQERAMLEFVAAGGGLAPLHCASYCFLNSPAYVELVGGQFKSHGTGTFKETIVQPDHPLMQGLSPIESWDETYVHTRHNTNRVVLAERRDDKGNEPYVWVRQHGKGRVFYTAWGHDQRTWSNPGFHAQVARGLRWASENSPNRLVARAGLKPFEYVEAPDKLPNYTPNAQWGTQGEPIHTMQKPLEPAESMRHLVTFPEFATSLFASEPDIVKPLWLAFDARGRLWIAESIDYPNEMKPAGEGRDRLKICEDTDGDGRADKFTVFADRLSIPSSFVFANGGVIVIHSGKAEFLKDTNGDDRADERKDLFTGWGTQDTHAAASNLRYGFDGWVWGVVGYSGFDGTVGGRRIRFGQGIFRFKPDGSALEYVRASNNNTWGLGLTEDNLVIGSTANGNASMYMPIPNRYYEAVNGWSAARLESIADSQNIYPITEKVRQVDFHGRYTAGSGSALYTARAFPEEYWNRVQFVAEPTGHLLGKFQLERQGADLVAHNGRSFLASDDEWTAPIYGEVGPDGALWVVDWYNYIIQHNPVPHGFKNGRGNAYETSLRDKLHGRIYRVTHGPTRPAGAPMNLETAAPAVQVAALKNDNLLWRLHAQRLLVERGNRDVVPALCALVRDPAVDAIGLNPAAIHALWTLHGLGAIEAGGDAGATATGALKHPSAAVRRAAVMVLPATDSSAASLLDAKVLDDGDAQVRLAALLALADFPASELAGRATLAMLQDPRNSDDRWIPEAATAAAARNDTAFLRAVLASYKPAQGPAAAETPANVIVNGSFEQVVDGKPARWRASTHSGRGDLALADLGRTGGRSAKISSERGGDISWATTVPVKPRTDYRLSGWIKTEKLQKVGNALGALFNVHELQDPVRGATKPIAGDNDWTRVEMVFNSGALTQVTINCLVGGWGRATGTAWFDDVELVPAAGSELAGEVGHAVRLVTAHYAQRGPVESIVPTLAALRGASPSVATAILEGLRSGWPSGQAPSLTAADQQTLSTLMEALPESARDRLLSLAQKWGRVDLFGASLAGIIQSLRRQVTDASRPDDERAAAARRWIGLEDKPDVIATVLGQINRLSLPALATGFINALSESRATNTGVAMTARWSELTPAARRAAIGVLLRRGEWAMALLDSVDQQRISRTDLAPEHWAQLKQHPNRAVGRRAERLAEIKAGISADREAIVKQLLPLARQKGDVARGKEVFAASCAVCHTMAGQGGKVGPDLTGIGARDRSDILLDILDPNRSVEANYRMWTVTTKDGESYSGRLETETQTTVEILDTAAQKHVVPRKEIESMEASQLSIMPTGFEALPPADLQALIEYLAAAHP